MPIDASITKDWYKKIYDETDLIKWDILSELREYLSNSCNPQVFSPDEEFICHYVQKRLNSYIDYLLTNQQKQLVIDFQFDRTNKNIPPDARKNMARFIVDYDMIEAGRGKLEENNNILYLRGFAIILLMIAIALRLSKVTVELLQWYNDESTHPAYENHAEEARLAEKRQNGAVDATITSIS